METAGESGRKERGLGSPAAQAACATARTDSSNTAKDSAAVVFAHPEKFGKIAVYGDARFVEVWLSWHSAALTVRELT